MQALRLREIRSAAPVDAKVIDASFRVVKGRTLWRRIKLALLAALGAALIGFLIPPLWIVAEHWGPLIGK